MADDNNAAVVEVRSQRQAACDDRPQPVDLVIVYSCRDYAVKKGSPRTKQIHVSWIFQGRLQMLIALSLSINVKSLRYNKMDGVTGFRPQNLAKVRACSNAISIS